MRHHGGVTVHRIRYTGPSTHAIEAATMLAEADGVELKSSAPPEPAETPGAMVLTLTVESTEAAIETAMRSIRAALPKEASIALDTANP
jgi:hypothetical protein